MSNLKKITDLNSTCKDYLQVQLANRLVVVVRFFRTTDIQFAELKNSIADHFRKVTKLVGFDCFNYGKFATINRLSLTTNHF